MATKLTLAALLAAICIVVAADEFVPKTIVPAEVSDLLSAAGKNLALLEDLEERRAGPAKSSSSSSEENHHVHFFAPESQPYYNKNQSCCSTTLATIASFKRTLVNLGYRLEDENTAIVKNSELLDQATVLANSNNAALLVESKTLANMLTLSKLNTAAWNIVYSILTALRAVLQP